MKRLLVSLCLLSILPLSFIAYSQQGGVESLPANYQSMTAESKQALLWENIENSEWKELPPLSGKGWASLIDSLKAAGSLATTFNHVSDELPVGRKKLLHPYGVAAKISFVVTKSTPYTGIFQSGGIGITRFSLAGDPKSIGFTPGLAIKFLIDGKSSVNLFAMNSLNGQAADTNWFKHTLSNKLPEPEGIALKAISLFFSFTHKTPNFLDLNHLAKVDRRGMNGEAKAPEQIFLVPGKAVKNLIPSDSTKDFRENLLGLKAGTELYQVFVSGMTNSGFIHIGSIVLETRFVASQYADKKLFFQHHH